MLRGCLLMITVRWKKSDSLLALVHSTDDQVAKNFFGAYKRHGVVEVIVTDDGVGLTKENLGNLFQEGWQFDAKRLQVRCLPREPNMNQHVFFVIS